MYGPICWIGRKSYLPVKAMSTDSWDGSLQVEYDTCDMRDIGG